MNNRIRYNADEVKRNTFYQLPKFLFSEEFKGLSNDAKVLYSILKDRHELSLKNQWVNENNEVYVICSRDNMCEILGLSRKTVIKAIDNLKKYNLIQEERQGLGKPNKIYLLSLESIENTKTCNFYTSRDVEFTHQEVENLHPNKTNQIKTDMSDKSSPVLSSRNNLNNTEQTPKKPDLTDREDSEHTKLKIKAYTEMIHENISYEDLTISHKFDMGFVDEIVDIIIDIILSESEYIFINSEKKPRELVRSVLMKLNYNHIEFVIEQFKSQTNKISKKKQYILTMLYNSKLEMDSHYTNEYLSDR